MKKARRSSRKRPKKPTRKQLQRRAYSVFGTWIKNRDDWTCIVCGRTREQVEIHCGHLISRKKQSVTFDEANNCAQCAPCNLAHNYWPEHYTKAYIKKYGLEAYQSLVERSKEVKQWKYYELEEIIKKYGG